MVAKHSCGFERNIYCIDCGTELRQDTRGRLYCPRCGRTLAILCPRCGRLW